MREYALLLTYLRNLVGEHVSIVVVGSHAPAALGPADDLHGGGVRDEVLQLAVRDQARGDVLLLRSISGSNTECYA